MVANRKKSTLRTRKYLLLSATLIVVLLIGSGILLHIRQNDKKKKDAALATASHTSTVNYGPSTPGDNQANNTRKGSSSPSQTLNDQPTSNTPSTASPFTATIVNSTVNNNNLHIGTLVSGTTSGTCSLDASQGSQQVNLATANVQQNVNEYDCGVFNIATSKFPNTGSWRLTLAVTSSGQRVTTSATVNIP